MIQGAASAASLTRPVSQSRTDTVQQDTQQQQARQAPPSDSDSVEISSKQVGVPPSGGSEAGASSAGGSAFETAQQVLEAKTQMVGESLDARKDYGFEIAVESQWGMQCQTTPHDQITGCNLGRIS